MALLDRKIPIITGINDTPSTTGQPKHPNASLLCKQYNDLIDNELTALQQSVASLPLPNSGGGQNGSDYYWVDSVNGDDATGDGVTTPYKTIARLHQRIAQDGVGQYYGCYLSGTFTNPDFNLLPYQTSSYYGDSKAQFTIYAFDNGQGSKIVIDNNYNIKDGHTATQLFRSVVPFLISIDIEFTADSALLLDNVDITFDSVALNTTAKQYGDLIFLNNSKLTLLNNIVHTAHPTTNIQPLINAYNSTIVLAHTTADWGGVAELLKGEHNVIWNLAPATDTSNMVLNYSQVFKNATTGITANNALNPNAVNHIVTL